MTQEVKDKIKQQVEAYPLTDLEREMFGDVFVQFAEFSYSLAQKELEEKDNEINRLKSLIKKEIKDGLCGIGTESENEKLWQQFKTDNKI